MTLGFRINPHADLIPAALIAAYRDVVTPHVSDNMHRLTGSCRLRPYHRSGKLVGTALTVRTRAGDNLMIHKALDLGLPGHVVVVDGGGDVTRALVGEIMATYAETRGIVGFVIDGAVRDIAYFAKGSFPCYARGVTHLGPYKDGPGEINVPVSIDGMVVQPGDLILGDEDGLVAVPAAETEAVLKLAHAKRDAEEQQIAAIRAGKAERRWVDETIRAKMGGK